MSAQHDQLADFRQRLADHETLCIDFGASDGKPFSGGEAARLKQQIKASRSALVASLQRAVLEARHA